VKFPFKISLMQATITIMPMGVLRYWTYGHKEDKPSSGSIQGLDSRPNREIHLLRLSAGNVHASGPPSANQGSCWHGQWACGWSRPRIEAGTGSG
jgi:hypothetical protein